MGLSGKSAKVFEYSAYTVVAAASVFLLYCFVRSVENKVALNILENRFNEKVRDLKERSDSLKTELIKIKNNLDFLKEKSRPLCEKSLVITYNFDDLNRAKSQIVMCEKDIEKYVDLMKEVGIYDDFENQYKLTEKKDKFYSIKDLDKLCENLSEELERAGKSAGGMGHCLEYWQVEGELSIYELEEVVHSPSEEEIKKEIAERVAKEKKAGSDVYKAYLRYNLVRSFVELLENKKAKAKIEEKFDNYKNVDIKKGLEEIKERVQVVVEKINNLMKDYDLEKFWPKGEAVYNYDRFLLEIKGLENVKNIKLSEDGSFYTVGLNCLEYAANALEKPINYLQQSFGKEALENKLNTKKKVMEKGSFLRIPGKQIKEAQSFNFDD